MNSFHRIGFVGQGFVGKNYANSFEERNFNIVRYALEFPYSNNKNLISFCDVVFIAVPTPTTKNGFDFSLIKESLTLVGKGKIAVIKSTVLPGTIRKLQEDYLNIFIIYSPEFLREENAYFDVVNPERNIIGVSVLNSKHQKIANHVISILPAALYTKVCSYEEAELIKYIGNNFLTTKVVFMNIMYEISSKLGCDWSTIKNSVAADSRIGESHMNIIHNGGRGAGGHCFVKDFSAFRLFYEESLEGQIKSIEFLKTVEFKNIELLKESNKNIDILEDVYGNF
ncbi:MAG: hypothetical protein KBC41_02710 [Candidatus Pacebacteria bacterium]|nr:hypothetical protein [Candidatus Paceibacterota bacterium]